MVKTESAQISLERVSPMYWSADDGDIPVPGRLKTKQSLVSREPFDKSHAATILRRA